MKGRETPKNRALTILNGFSTVSAATEPRLINLTGLNGFPQGFLVHWRRQNTGPFN